MPVMFCSVAGASDREIHGVFQQEAVSCGIRLTAENYVVHNAPRIAIGDSSQAALLHSLLFLPDGPNNRLCLVGKSAGAMQIWSLLFFYPSLFQRCCRIAAVLIDPHGAVMGDGEVGSYRDSQPLTRPNNWPIDKNRFRLWHVFQQRKGPTGARFEDCAGLFESCMLTADMAPNIDHTNIPEHPIARRMIGDAIRWASAGS